MADYHLIAAAAFGMEALVVRELKDLGYQDATVEDGRVHFRGDASTICRANLWLRCAERVQIVVGDFPARDFDQLFDKVKATPWEEWLAADAKFPVNARLVRSDIRSVPNTQKMVKRAIVDRLRQVYSRHWFAETGTEYVIDVHVLGDRVLVTLDTTGDGLHKRGYRNLVGQAPLRETVAAGMVKLSYWNRDRLLVDPFCGSGTIPIEAAMIGRNLAPGRNRSFAAEAWSQIPASVWSAARQEVKDLENRQPLSIPIVATDRDARAIKMATQHARQAGVATDIHFEVKDFVAFPTNRDAGILICNPPYGERLGSESEVRQLYRDMGELLRPLDDWSLYILTGAEGFEREFGKQADRRRKLYNARIACTYYQYLGPKPSGILSTPEDGEDRPASTPEKQEWSQPQEVSRPVEVSRHISDVPEKTTVSPSSPWAKARLPQTSKGRYGETAPPAPSSAPAPEVMPPVSRSEEESPVPVTEAPQPVEEEARKTEPVVPVREEAEVGGTLLEIAGRKQADETPVPEAANPWQNRKPPSPPAPDVIPPQSLSEEEIPASVTEAQQPVEEEARKAESVVPSPEETEVGGTLLEIARRKQAEKPPVPEAVNPWQSRRSAVSSDLPREEQPVSEESPEPVSTEETPQLKETVETPPKVETPTSPAHHPWKKNPWQKKS